MAPAVLLCLDYVTISPFIYFNFAYNEISSIAPSCGKIADDKFRYRHLDDQIFCRFITKNEVPNVSIRKQDKFCNEIATVVLIVTPLLSD